MKHASTRALFSYWQERRGSRPAPTRDEIDPRAIAPALGDTFTLSADFADQLRFCLAGTRVCALFCREIKGEVFSHLWRETDRRTIEDVLGIVTCETEAVVTGLAGKAEDGASADLEMLLLPLALAGRARTCVLGVLVPATPTYWIGVKPIVGLSLKAVRHLGVETAAGSFGPPEGSRLRHGFTVYSGGRDDEPAEQAG